MCVFEWYVHDHYTIILLKFIPGEHRCCTDHRRLDRCVPHSQAERGVCVCVCVCVEVGERKDAHSVRETKHP